MRTPRREKERGHRAARARETANTGGWSVTQEAGVAERRTALDQVLGRADSKTALTMRGFHHGKHREEKGGSWSGRNARWTAGKGEGGQAEREYPRLPRST